MNIFQNGLWTTPTLGERSGRAAKWYERLTGMRERRRAATGENANTMAISAVAQLAAAQPGILQGVDLIIGGSYTPWDMIATMAHVVQRRLRTRPRARFSSHRTCSSFLNALELTAAYFESGRASHALLVMSEHNSLYSSDDDPMSGHLWGDGLAAARVATTVDVLGNTGCASIPITLHRHRHLLKSGDCVMLTAFGGGYCAGAALAYVE